MKSRNTGLLFNRFVLRAELIKKRERKRERKRENGKGGKKWKVGGGGGGEEVGFRVRESCGGLCGSKS